MVTVLIVDDSRTSRRFLRNMLTEAGYEVVAEAVDGEDGMKNMRNLNRILLQWILPCQSWMGLMQSVRF